MSSLLEDLAVNPDEVAATPVQIETFLRDKIRTGELRTGERLPSTQELAKLWGVSAISVQKAMTRLSADGLLERIARRGTFVRSHTEKVTIAILSGVNLADQITAYARAVVRSLQEQMAQRDWNWLVYDSLNVSTPGPNGDRLYGHRRLMSDIRNRRLTGAVAVALGPRWCEGLDGADRLPIIRIGQIISQADISNDYYWFGRDTVEWCVGHGIARIACLSASEMSEAVHGICDATVAGRLPMPRVHSLDLVRPQGIETAAHDQMLRLIDSWEQRHDYPEALIVSDDVAMRGVALALIKRDVDVPKTLRVITLANDGVDIHYGLPVTRYEFSPKDDARLAVELLWKKVRGETMPRLPVMLRGKICEEER